MGFCALWIPLFRVSGAISRAEGSCSFSSFCCSLSPKGEFKSDPLGVVQPASGIFSCPQAGGVTGRKRRWAGAELTPFLVACLGTLVLPLGSPVERQCPLENFADHRCIGYVTLRVNRSQLH